MNGIARRTSVLASVVFTVGLALGAAPAVSAATDTDHDGLPDVFERTMTLTDPRRADTNRNGIPDGSEDPDHDGLTNRQEYITGTHPRRADTNHNGVRDDREDPDHDGLNNRYEFLAGTHPLRADTNRNGIPDGAEDPDHDGLTNQQEQSRGTLPRVGDTDHDTFPDGAEVIAATDPRNAASHPVPPTVPAPTVPGADCQIFPSDNVWNVAIDSRSVASDREPMIAAIGLDRGLPLDFGS